jgi:hypothetical protein
MPAIASRESTGSRACRPHGEIGPAQLTMRWLMVTAKLNLLAWCIYNSL